MKKIAVLIPAFNASETIRGVISGVMEHVPADRILVVDDGSSDGTALLPGSLAFESLNITRIKGRGPHFRPDSIIFLNPLSTQSSHWMQIFSTRLVRSLIFSIFMKQVSSM